MSGWTIQIDPPAIAPDRAVLDLNSGPIQVGTSEGGSLAIDWGLVSATEFETQQGQWGNSVSDIILPNRTVTINLLLGGTDEQGNEETARSDLQQKVALLQREGGQLLRQRAGGPAMYADIVGAQLTLPDVWGETGDVEPDVVLALEILPDMYGDEITLDTIHCTGYCDAVLEQSGVQAVIEGDYPARCRVVLQDTSGNPRDGLYWGFRSRYYDGAVTAALVYEAENLPISGSVSVTTLAGASNGQVVTDAAVTGATPMIILYEPPTFNGLTHIGSYRVVTRAYSTTGDVEVFLSWTPGIGTPINNTPAAIPAANEFYLLDLGVIRLDPNPLGGSVWSGSIFAQPAGGGSCDLSLDQVFLVPLDESAGLITDTDNGVVPTGALGTSEVRSEGTWIQVGASGHEAWTYVGGQIGDLPRLPPSALEGRPVQVLLKPFRNTTGDSDDTGLDTFTAQVIYRPCYAGRP